METSAVRSAQGNALLKITPSAPNIPSEKTPTVTINTTVVRCGDSLDSGSTTPTKALAKKRQSADDRKVSGRSTVVHRLSQEKKDKEKKQLKKKLAPTYIAIPRFIVQNKIFILVTTVLTIYALVGINVRDVLTEQPVDTTFDVITSATMVIFVVEIVLSSLGKEDYFLSFFFTLDVVSTLSLLLDLSFFPSFQKIFGGEGGDSGQSDAARIGGRAGRVSRVIRLVRIVKLYKVAVESWAARKVNKRADNEDDWDDIDVADRPQQVNGESQVGKKLSELTIRRVIILVLLMLIVQPLLAEQDSKQYDTSMNYGADAVGKAFRILVTKVDAEEDTTDARSTYETALLKYMYYHNWYSAKEHEETNTCYNQHEGVGESCSGLYPGQQLFFVGIVGKASTAVLQSKAAVARISTDLATVFAQEAFTQQQKYQFGILPPNVQQIIYGPWSQECEWDDSPSSQRLMLGLSLLREESGIVDYAVPCPDDLRTEEVSYTYERNVAEDAWNEWHLVFYFDKRSVSKSEATMQLYMICFVCCMLLMASLWFTSDANALVLGPVENMISKVEAIRLNPLMAMKIADEEFKKEEINRVKQAKPRDRFTVLLDLLSCKSSKPMAEPMETVILEKTIIKLGSLLALGFGEAGVSIIEHNMHGIDSACVDALVDGKRVECIIGATRIRDFGVATEVLQSKIMTFVNQIAEIVHGVVDEFHGAANKNNGDTFLMIWRTSELPIDVRAKMADMAMLAFTRIIASVHRSPVLASYRGHPGLQQRLGKNCRVNMGSAIHYGWAIEGAVGSEFKIDASYLSPNVSLAESMERATQIYKVSVLVADSVVDICTPGMASKCRLIDKIKMTGSVTPMELFVIDIDYMALTVEPPLHESVTWNSRARFKARQCLEAEKSAKISEDSCMQTLFNEHPDIVAMRYRYTLEFMHVFDMGYQNYSQGEWQVAQRLLSRTRTMLRVEESTIRPPASARYNGVVSMCVEDGPSAALLRFMETHHRFEAPDWWKGIRDLDQSLREL